MSFLRLRSLAAGKNLTGRVDGTLGHELDAGSKIFIDAEISLIKKKFSFSCDMCGANCTIPLPTGDVIRPAPPCPIAAGSLDPTKFSHVVSGIVMHTTTKKKRGYHHTTATLLTHLLFVNFKLQC